MHTVHLTLLDFSKANCATGTVSGPLDALKSKLLVKGVLGQADLFPRSSDRRI